MENFLKKSNMQTGNIDLDILKPDNVVGGDQIDFISEYEIFGGLLGVERDIFLELIRCVSLEHDEKARNVCVENCFVQ
jgi:hypothetical protein